MAKTKVTLKPTIPPELPTAAETPAADAATPVNPNKIIEQQLARLQAISERGCTLSLDEVKTLEALVKLQIVLRIKGNAAADAEDPFADMSTEELKALLPVLGN